MIRVRLSLHAQQDVRDAVAWYESQQAGLGEAFDDDLAATLAQLRQFPDSAPAVIHGLKRGQLSRFPYSVFFRRHTDHLWVVGVLHHARDPRIWRARR